MARLAVETDACRKQRESHPALSDETRQLLGTTLRTIYEDTCDTQPIPDVQVDLLLRLRQRERELRRAG